MAEGGGVVGLDVVRLTVEVLVGASDGASGLYVDTIVDSAEASDGFTEGKLLGANVGVYVVIK